MAVFNNILAGASGATGAAGYQIDRSLRFNSGDSSYLSRTPSSEGNRRTWTWSGWVKRSKLGVQQALFMCEISFSEFAQLSFNSSDQLQSYLDDDGSGGQIINATSAVFRDTSAWYHVVWSVDSTKATASDRVKLYVNGVDQSYTGGNIPQDGSHAINSTTNHSIGIRLYNSTVELDAYLAEVHFIDGQALAPTDFGEYDDNGVWQPKAYSGTYGTNGFHLDFSDNSSASALGTDAAGSNDWTVNNLSVASGSGNDSLIDTPTNYTAASGNNGGNYCTLNPLKNQDQTLTNGNLVSNGVSGRSTGTLYASSGKFYWEFTAATDYTMSGIESSTSPQAASYPGENDQQYALYGNAGSGLLYHNGSTTSVDGFVSGDVIGVALDMDGGNLYFYKNGSAMNSGSAVVTGLTGAWTANCRSGSGAYNGDTIFNFGQRPFAYTPPTGFKSLCTQNLPDPTIADGSTAFDAKLYTSNNSTLAVTGYNFSPDFVWIKNRATANHHGLFDIVRGANKLLSSNRTNAEITTSGSGYGTGTFNSFDSNGFTLGNDVGANVTNYPSGDSHVAWAWDAGTSTVSNTDGSITSNVRANASAGFSIVSYTSTNVAGATVGHGLNAAMNFAIFKNRDRSQNWLVYHKSLDITSGEAINLNSTSAAYSSQAQFNSTLATNSVFTLGAGGNASYQAGDDMIAYCFAPVEGYSAFGSYTGTSGSNGAFVYTGMRPSFLLIKSTTRVSDWIIIDTARDVDNLSNLSLEPNTSNAEASNTQKVDILSNGFKLRGTDGDTNANGASYIYAAFAEHPFKTARAR
jgi:hypothetical protein